MGDFTVVLAEHGYATTQHEKTVVTGAGGRFIDAADLPLDQALELCRNAEGILVRRIQITPELVATFSRCKIVLRYGVGVDNVNLDACTKAGIIVGHVPVYCADEVSNHAIALWLACVRRVTWTHDKMRAGEWDVNRAEPIFRTEGKTFGIVGLGNIGIAMARKLSGWGMRVIAHDRYADFANAMSLGIPLVPLDVLCARSDYISLHVPLVEESFHLLGKPQFGLMKRGVMIINTARGPVLDTDALLDAIHGGIVSAAGLDVFEEEPLPAAHTLRSHPKVVLSDHVAWYSEDSQAELQTRAAQEVVRACTGGLPLAIANPQVLRVLGREAEWKPQPFAKWQFTRIQSQS